MDFISIFNIRYIFMPATKKILIIEDDRPVAKALETKLVRAGFEIKVAEDGERALEILGKESFSLILLDLVLPKIDGFKVLEDLRGKGDKTLVIVLTNLSQTEGEGRVKELGVSEFFVKSNTPIVKIVERVKEKLSAES